jgi:DNA-binding transcriptional ArsR family regulator
VPDENDKKARLDQAFIRALAHPVRVEILEVLNEREASPKELEEILTPPLGNLSYHCKVLSECGCIELVRTEQRRGALEHFFRATPRSFVGHQDLRKVPQSLRGNVTAMSLQSFLEASVAAMEAGTIDGRPDSVLGWMVIGVDELGWEQAVDLGRSTLDRFERVHEESRERATRGGQPLRPMVVGLAGFEAAMRKTKER